MSNPAAPRPLLLLRNGAYLFLTKAAPALAALLVVVLYSRGLSRDDYGRYTSIWVRLGIFGTLAYAGLPVLLLSLSAPRLKAWLGSLGIKQRMGLAAWMLSWAGVFAVVQWASIGLPPLLSVAILLLYAATAILESAIVASGRLTAMSWGGVAYAVLFAGLHWGVLKLGYNLSTLLTGIVSLQAIRLAGYALLCANFYRTLSAEALPDPDRTRRYWLHTGLYDVSVNVARWADKSAVSFLLAAALSAIYFNGSIEVPFIPYLMGAAGSVVLVELAKEGRPSGTAARLVADVARIQTVIVLPLFFFLLFFRAEIFSVVFGEKYAASVPVFAASLLVLPLRSYHFTALLEAKQEGRIINAGAALDIVLTLVSIFPLYKILGLPGIALAPVISTWVQMLYYLMQTSRVYRIPIARLFPFRHWAAALACFGLLFSALHQISALIEDEKRRLFLAAGVAILIGCAALYFEIRRYRKQHGKLQPATPATQD